MVSRWVGHASSCGWGGGAVGRKHKSRDSVGVDAMTGGDRSKLGSEIPLSSLPQGRARLHVGKCMAMLWTRSFANVGEDEILRWTSTDKVNCHFLWT